MSQPPHGPGDGHADRDQPPAGPPPGGVPPTGWRPPHRSGLPGPPAPGESGGPAGRSPWLLLGLGCGGLFLIGVALVLLIVFVFDDRGERSEGAGGPPGHGGASVTGDRPAA
jgi:hypothetical protein